MRNADALIASRVPHKKRPYRALQRSEGPDHSPLCGANEVADRPISKSPRIGYIYVIASGPHRKIGRSWCAGGRLRELQTGSAETLRLVHEVPVPSRSASKVERRAHKCLADFHLRGERYHCSDVDAVAAIHAACSELGVPHVSKSQVEEIEGALMARKFLRLHPEFTQMFVDAFPELGRRIV